VHQAKVSLRLSGVYLSGLGVTEPAGFESVFVFAYSIQVV